MNPQVTSNDTTTNARYVRSFTNPNQFYVVALNPRGFWECDCPAAQFNRRTPCKHVKAVAKDGAGIVPKPKAPATPRARSGDVVMTGLNLADEGMLRPARRAASEAISVGLDL
jgi:hypothetical protein